MSSGQVQRKTVLITGASGGIGRAIARTFAATGANLVLSDRDRAVLESATKDDLRDIVGEACLVDADVTDESQFDRVVEKALQRFGRIDAAVLNAGIQGMVAPFGEIDIEDFDRVMAVNVRGVFIGLNRLMPVMKRQDKGAIVVMSSTAGLRGTLNLAPYAASKHAVIGLMRTAALEGAQHNVRVNTVNPGPIETTFTRTIETAINPKDPDAGKQVMAASTPMRRYGTPQEVANLVAFLASDEATYCTGNTYVLDGGIMAGRA
jgi:NAD(P)-dependent dehydrogenase (short-subunit alcohol dehydrogenase family)